MRHRLILAVPIVGCLALLLVAVTIATSADPLLSTEPEGVAASALSPEELAPATPLTSEGLFRAALGAGLMVDAREVIGRDTIRYRVCKDLSICYLDVPAPIMGVAMPVLPPDVASPVLVPVEVFAMPPPPVLTESRWALLGLPLLGLAGYGLLGNDEFTPGGSDGSGGGGGGGEPPPGPEPPGPEPPGPEPPGPEPPGPEPPGPPGPEPPGPPGPEPPGPPGPGPPGPEPPGPPTNVVPEPASLILLGTGLAGLAVHRRLRRGRREDGE